MTNPILHAGMGHTANTVFNPGASLLADGSVTLLCRVEDRAGHSHLTAARSADGISNWAIDTSPTLSGDGTPEERFGIEDPGRITRLDDGRYAAASRPSAKPALRLPRDDFRLRHLRPPRHHPPAQQQRRRVFPTKVAGQYAILHRPSCPDAGGGI
ncbi:MAG: hypothetical protein R3B46_12040 [Phycisphaerales bacterium]